MIAMWDFNTLGRQHTSIGGIESLIQFIDLMCKLKIANVICLVHWEVKPQLMIFGNGMEIKDESSVYGVEIEIHEGTGKYKSLVKRPPICRRFYVDRR